MCYETLELYCTSIDNEGRAIARDETNRVILVENALPKSKIRAKITEIKKNFAKAVCVEVLEKSPHEIKPKCNYFSNCGGCTWQNLDYTEQLVCKKQIIFDALTRIAKLDKTSPLLDFSVQASNNVYEYRNKMEFAFGKNQANDLVLGLKSAKSHNIIPVECNLTKPIVTQVIARLAELCKEYRLDAFSENKNKIEGFLRHAVVRVSENENNEISNFLLEIITYPRQEYNKALQTICAKIVKEFEFITGIVHSTRKNLLPLAYGEHTVCTQGKISITDEVHIHTPNITKKLNLKHTHQSFFQVNSKGASDLYSAVVKLVLENNIKYIADIYCGVGGIGIACASTLNSLGIDYSLHGLETMPHAIKLAKENAQHAEIEADFTCGNAKNLYKFLEKLPELDAVILDPPRAGIDKTSMQTLLKKQIPYLILVSCNPATLARDLKELESKYSIVSIQAFDLFPHTPHVESLCLLKKL